jgi:L-fucose isomerase-like protein
MLDEDDYADDPIQTAATTGERIETSANDALEGLDRGPATGEVEDALSDAERAVEEIRRQQEAAEEALDRLTGSTYGAGGVVSLAEGADDAYDLLDEIRGMSRSMVEGLVAAEAGSEPAAETEVEIAGTRYRIRFDPMEEAETGEPIDDESE